MKNFSMQGDASYRGGGWESYSDYMSDKSKKLKEQYKQTYIVKSHLFQGLTFWQTGRSFELDIKKLVSEHGGIYEQYGLRKVTHIVAQTVATSNQQWRALLHGGLHKFKVVKPQWVVDCIKQARRLNEADYLPEGLESNQKNIFYIKKSDKNKTLQHTENFPSPLSVYQITKSLKGRVSDEYALEICHEIASKNLHITSVQVKLISADWSLIVRNLNNTYSVLEALHQVFAEIHSNTPLVELTVSCFTSPFIPAIPIFPSVSPIQRLETSMLSLHSCQDFHHTLAEIATQGGLFALRAAAIDALHTLAEKRKFDKFRKLLLALKKIRHSDSILTKAMQIFACHYRGGTLKL